MSSVLCLYKYQNYVDDGDNVGAWNKQHPCFNSKQKRLHSVTQSGDNLYVVTYKDGRCYLLSRMTISNKGFNRTDYPYGIYRIEGEPSKSQFWSSGKKDVTEILRKLDFKTGKRIGNSTRPLSLHLQTIRELTENDESKLDSITP